MAAGETGYADVMLDLLSIQDHSRQAGHDYDRFLRDAEKAGLQEVAFFIRLLMQEDSARAAHCHALMNQFTSTDETGPAEQ
jgi:hypothetical protein